MTKEAWKSRELMRVLGVRKVSVRSLMVARESLKLKVKVKRYQLYKATKNEKRIRQREVYREFGPKMLHQQTLKPRSCGAFPTVQQMEEYWSKILTVRGSCDTQSSLLELWRKEIKQKIQDDVEDVQEIGDAIWQYVHKKVESWHAPRRDGIQGYWWRHFPSASGHLRNLFN